MSKNVQIPVDIFELLYDHFVTGATTDDDVHRIRKFLTDKQTKRRAHMFYDIAFRQKDLPQEVRQAALDEYNDIVGRHQDYRYPIDHNDGPPEE